LPSTDQSRRTRHLLTVVEVHPTFFAFRSSSLASIHPSLPSPMQQTASSVKATRSRICLGIALKLGSAFGVDPNVVVVVVVEPLDSCQREKSTPQISSFDCSSSSLARSHLPMQQRQGHPPGVGGVGRPGPSSHPVSLFRTVDTNNYAVEFSPFRDGLLAVASSQYFGIVGNGKQLILQMDGMVS